MTINSNRLLNTRDVCERLKLHINTVYLLILSNQLKAHKLGGDRNSRHHWRIRERDLEAFINGKVAAGEAHTEHSS